MNQTDGEIRHLRDELSSSRKALKKADQTLQRLFKQTPIMLHSIDATGRLTHVNDEWLATLGYDENEVIGKKATGFLTKASRDDTERRCLPSFFKTGRIRNEELQFLTKTGKVVDVLLSASSLRDADDGIKNSLSVSVNITERRQAERALQEIKKRMQGCEAQLSSLTKHLSLAEHNERRRIAANLHDQVAQSLTLAKMKLNQVKARDPRASEHLGELESALELAIADIRTVIYDMSPFLDDLGSEIESLANHFSQAHGIRVIVDDHGTSQIIDEASKVFLYRAVSELLINAIKHANATRIVVAIQSDADFLSLQVEDDGRGFDASNSTTVVSSGFGLREIRTRIQRLGGSLEIKTQPSEGTVVLLSLPHR